MGVSGFSSEVSGFSSGVSGFSSGVFGLTAGISRNRNFDNALRRSDGTSREMGGALAPPFEHLVYICAASGFAADSGLLGSFICWVPRARG